MSARSLAAASVSQETWDAAQRKIWELTGQRAELMIALRDIVTYVSAGDDVPLQAMLDDARAALAKVTP